MPVLLERKQPYHLEEVRLIDCKMSLSVANRFIEMLHERSFLQKLALVNTSLSEKSIESLSLYV